MMRRTAFKLLVTVLLVLSAGCEDRQYVNPDTVALSITNRDTGRERLQRCNYIPVLLGSQIDARYAVEGAVNVSLSLTREHVIVSFDGAAAMPEPWIVESGEFHDREASVTLESAPQPYEVTLSSPCEGAEP